MRLFVEKEINNSDIPEEEIIRQAQEGNAAAFEHLYRRYSSRVYFLCLRMLKNVSEAEEMTQEAFLLLFRKIHTFRGEAKFSTWLHRLAFNLVLMSFRKKRYPEVSLDATMESGEEDSVRLIEFGGPDPRLSGMIDHVNLSKAIEKLPDGYREMFILHDVEGSNPMRLPGFWDARSGIPSPSCTRHAAGFVNCCRKRFAVVLGRSANQHAA